MIRLDNYTKPIERRGSHEYYRWRVIVDEDPEVLSSLKEVPYELHPTFPNPRRTETNPEDNFPLETEGWGESSLVAKVQFRKGQTETIMYWVELSKDWPDIDR